MDEPTNSSKRKINDATENDTQSRKIPRTGETLSTNEVNNNSIVVDQEGELSLESLPQPKKRKENLAIEYNNHFWHKSKSIEAGKTIYYDCEKRKTDMCKARLTAKLEVNGSYSFTQGKVEHNHLADARKVEVKKRLAQAKEEAISTTKPNRLLYGTSLSGASEEVIALMPSQKTFSKNMQNQRRKETNVKAPKKIDDMALDDVYTTSGEKFLLFDSAHHEHMAPDERIVILCSQTARDFLSLCNILFMDGTVDSSPLLFNQLYTIHGSHNNWKVPLVFSLCTKKQTKTYETIFRQVKSIAPNLNPEQLNLDFEQAAINAAKQVWPDAKIQGCYFHLSQSIGKNLGTNSLKPRYEKDAIFASEIRQMRAVAFLPVKEVIKEWENFILNSKTLNPEEQKKDSKIRNFVTEYFGKNYVGKLNPDGKRKSPRFPIELWNVHEATLNGLPRTNNAAEGFHNAHSSMTGTKRPTIHKFIEFLKKDEDIARKKITDCRNGLNPEKRKNSYIRSDLAIKASVEAYCAAVKLQEEMASAYSDEEEDLQVAQVPWKNSPAAILLKSIASNT